MSRAKLGAGFWFNRVFEDRRGVTEGLRVKIMVELVHRIDAMTSNLFD